MTCVGRSFALFVCLFVCLLFFNNALHYFGFTVNNPYYTRDEMLRSNYCENTNSFPVLVHTQFLGGERE